MFMKMNQTGCPFCGETSSIAVEYGGEPMRRCNRCVCMKVYAMNADGTTRKPEQVRPLLRFESVIRSRKF